MFLKRESMKKSCARLCLVSSVLLILALTLIPTTVLSAETPVIKPGMHWSINGTNTSTATGTRTYEGSLKQENKWTEAYEVESVDEQAIQIKLVSSGQWSTEVSGWFKKWWGEGKLDGSYSDTYHFTIDRTTSRYTKGPTQWYNNKPAWFVVNPSKIDIGSQIPQTWWNERGDVVEVFYAMKESTARIKDAEVTVWEASYSGPAIGYWNFVGSKFQVGSESDTLMFDEVFGLLVAWSAGGTYTYDTGAGIISETFERDSSLEDSNIWTLATFDAEPRSVSMTVDGKTYSSSELPKNFLWISDSTHNFNVEATLAGDAGVRYVFTQWSDGTKDASRSTTLTEDATFKAIYSKQYQLSVVSERGNPQGSGWYDQGSSATFSVTSPLRAEDLMGALGGKYVFDHWTGDSTSTTASASVIMDGPKIVEAAWGTDYTVPYIIIAAIVIAAVVAALLVLMKRRKA